MKGIDVAKWNGTIDWTKVKSDGVKFAILKAINKSRNTEEAFERNYKGASSVGIPVSAYNYSYATSVQEATMDAQKVIDVCKGKKIDFVWLDVEDNCQKNIGMLLIDIINAYKMSIERAGLNFGVYTGLSFYKTFLKPYGIDKNIPVWIARYPYSKKMPISENPNKEKLPNIPNVYAWQYTSNGIVAGISGKVDLNIIYDAEEDKLQRFSKRLDGNDYVSKNFKVKEFACKDNSDEILIDVDFVKNKLQKIRDYFACPVIINSAYRTQGYNKKVGGASKSYHMQGRAFDIVVKNIPLNDVCKYAEQIGIKGIIRYNTFVHVDSRNSNYFAINNNGKVTSQKTFL